MRGLATVIAPLPSTAEQGACSLPSQTWPTFGFLLGRGTRSLENCYTLFLNLPGDLGCARGPCPDLSPEGRPAPPGVSRPQRCCVRAQALLIRPGATYPEMPRVSPAWEQTCDPEPLALGEAGNWHDSLWAQPVGFQSPRRNRFR